MKKRCSLTPNEGLLSNEQYQMVYRLESYDISFVFEKLLADSRISKYKMPLLEREFKRFFALTGFGIFPVAMISPRIDDVWHQFILFTKQYKEFCLKTVGIFIGHQPDTSTTPVPVLAGENFRSAYKQFFGELPEIWFEGMDVNTRNYYLQPKLIGKPPKSWSGWAGPE